MGMVDLVGTVDPVAMVDNMLMADRRYLKSSPQGLES